MGESEKSVLELWISSVNRVRAPIGFICVGAPSGSGFHHEFFRGFASGGVSTTCDPIMWGYTFRWCPYLPLSPLLSLMVVASSGFSVEFPPLSVLWQLRLSL